MNNKFRKKIIILLSSILTLVFTISSCNLLNEEKKYEITYDYIKGEEPLDWFSVAELEVHSMIDEFGRPGSYDEVDRVVCKKNKEKEFKYKIFFHKPNHGYTWEYLGEVININEIIPDSIKNKEFEEQIAYVNEIDTVINVDEERLKSHDIIPLKFKPATWYHIFGLEGIEGSYFVYINDNRTIEVKYFDGGP